MSRSKSKQKRRSIQLKRIRKAREKRIREKLISNKKA